MRRTGLILLALAVFVLFSAAGGAYLYLSPRGALRPEGPAEAVQAELERQGAAHWRQEFARLCAPAVTEFEDAAQVAERLYDAAVGDKPLTFREEDGGSARECDFILSAGDTDLLRLPARFRDDVWQISVEGLSALRPESRAVTVTVPSDARVSLNGKPLGEQYISERALPYEDMTALELRFSEPPTRTRYTVEGLYECPRVEVERPGGVTLLSCDGYNWSYTVPDAAGYAFLIRAPREAAVSVNGAALTEADVTGAAEYQTDLSIPVELEDLLPSMVYYAAGGLYTKPEVISAVLPDGTALTPEIDADGTVVFTAPSSQALEAACRERVGAFMRQMCEFGAGHTGRNYPAGFTAPGSPLYSFFQNALASLQWTHNVTVTYQREESFNYIPLGDSAFLCRGEVDCTTSTYHQTKELHLAYEMLWVSVDGVWCIQDLAYAD